VSVSADDRDTAPQGNGCESKAAGDDVERDSAAATSTAAEDEAATGGETESEEPAGGAIGAETGETAG